MMYEGDFYGIFCFGSEKPVRSSAKAGSTCAKMRYDKEQKDRLSRYPELKEQYKSTFVEVFYV